MPLLTSAPVNHPIYGYAAQLSVQQTYAEKDCLEARLKPLLKQKHALEARLSHLLSLNARFQAPSITETLLHMDRLEDISSLLADYPLLKAALHQAIRSHKNALLEIKYLQAENIRLSNKAIALNHLQTSSPTTLLEHFGKTGLYWRVQDVSQNAA